jgi:aminopeptidase N
MENISATTLHGFTVIPKKLWADRDSDGLIAHELAHQWFGDYVTCRDWAHIWLNESFATYFEALWEEHAHGADAMTEDLAGGAGWYFGQENEYSRPIVCDVYSDPDDVFDACAYPKGAWVLHMIRKSIGDDAWWEAIRDYLKRGDRVVESRDFQAVFRRVLSGKDIDWLIEPWLYRTGHPEFEVTSTHDAAAKKVRVTIEQKQKIVDRACGPLKTGSTVFKTYADIEVTTKSGRVNKRFFVDEAKETFEVDVEEEPLLVEFDPDGWILKTVKFAKPQKELRYMLLENDEACGRKWAAEQLGACEKPEPESVAALARALEDPFAAVVRAAADALSKVKSRDALLTARPKDARARWAVYQALGSFLPDDAVQKALLEAIDRDDSLNCRATAAQALGKCGSLKVLDDLATRFAKDDVILPGVLSAMLECGDAGAVPTLVRATRYGVHPWIRGRAVQCLGDLMARKRDGHGVDTLIELLADPSFRIRRTVVGKLGDIGDERAVPALEKRIAQEFDGRLIKDIHKAVRKIRAPKKK